MVIFSYNPKLHRRLIEFKSCGGVWSGRMEDTSLFEVWSNISSEVHLLKLTSTHSENQDSNSSTSNNEFDIYTLDNTLNNSFENSNNERDYFHIREDEIRAHNTTPTPTSSSELQEVQSATINQTNVPNDVPSPFKNCLFWPVPSNEQKRKRSKEKIPYWATYLTYHHQRGNDNPLRLIERHFPSLYKPPRKNRNRRCVVCTANDKRRESRYECKDCNVGLCVEPCFRIYHTELHY
ncbi:PiggyBac transposable element-derived protein 4 [Anthophora retusa]